MLHSTLDAQAASSIQRDPFAGRRAAPAVRPDRPTRRSLGLAVAGVVLAGLVAAPSASASTAVRTPDGTAAAPLTTTTIDKPWYSVERFYLGLVNCTRTGGWVLSDGTCRGYGSGRYSAYVTPLVYSYGLSDKVSRPYAKVLAVRNLCSHDVGGSPGDRLRRAGYLRYTWGENIGCRDGYESAKTAVLASHRAFQAEKSTGGGHWKNIKNAKYRWIGIGVWRYGSRTRLVTNFYG